LALIAQQAIELSLQVEQSILELTTWWRGTPWTPGVTWTTSVILQLDAEASAAVSRAVFAEAETELTRLK
jgi:hypothetical protein